MNVVGITIRELEVTFSLTQTEVDKLSLALSKCEISAFSDEEKEAAKELQKFAAFLNTLQDKVEQTNAVVPH